MNDIKLRRLRDQASNAATLISEGCRISGKIKGDCDLVVSGTVAGDCNINGTVTLAGNGNWLGTVHANNVIVAGQIEGDILADGRVEITNTAKINGTVTAEAIAVAEGAVVEGVMKTTGQIAPQEFVEKREH